MYEPRSELPLHHYLAGRTDAASRNAGIALVENARKGHLVLRGDRNAPAFAAACESVLGFALPARVKASARSATAACYCLGPDEWLLLLEAGAEWGTELRIRDAFDGHCSLVDVSGGQTVLSLSGERLPDLLKKSCSYDFSPDHFLAGQCVQTNFAKATALVIKQSDTHFDLVVRRSFSDYMFAWIADASAEYGFHASADR